MSRRMIAAGLVGLVEVGFQPLGADRLPNRPSLVAAR